MLATLYNATNGANWEDNSNWLSNRPVREWYGVTNDTNGRVSGLYLWENQLDRINTTGVEQPPQPEGPVPQQQPVDRTNSTAVG